MAAGRGGSQLAGPHHDHGSPRRPAKPHIAISALRDKVPTKYEHNNVSWLAPPCRDGAPPYMHRAVCTADRRRPEPCRATRSRRTRRCSTREDDRDRRLLRAPSRKSRRRPRGCITCRQETTAPAGISRTCTGTGRRSTCVSSPPGPGVLSARSTPGGESERELSGGAAADGRGFCLEGLGRYWGAGETRPREGSEC